MSDFESSMPPSLRERKKNETWHLINDIAAGLALDAQSGQVTIDTIAKTAGISQRTFFNYFPTKEDAILGIRKPVVPSLPSDFLDGAGLLRRTTDLLLRVTRSGYGENQEMRRARLFRKYPYLLIRRRELVLQSEEIVQQVLVNAMNLHPHWSEGIQGRSVQDTARMLTTIAGIPPRYTLTSQGGQPGALLEDESVSDLIDFFDALYREIS